MNYTKGIETIFADWKKVVSAYSDKAREIDQDKRLSDSARAEDHTALKTVMENELITYKTKLQQEWSNLKKLASDDRTGNLEDVSHALTIIKTIGKGLTADVFDSIITDGMRQDMGSMRMIKAAIDSADLYENIKGCKSLDILKAVETFDQEIIEAESYSYQVLGNWKDCLTFSIGQTVLMDKVRQIDSSLQTIKN